MISDNNAPWFAPPVGCKHDWSWSKSRWWWIWIPLKVEIRLDLKMYCWNMKDFCMLPSMLDVHLFLQDHCYYFSCIGYKMFLRNRIINSITCDHCLLLPISGCEGTHLFLHTSFHPQIQRPEFLLCIFIPRAFWRQKTFVFVDWHFLGNHVWLVFREELATIGYQSEQHRLSFGEWDSIWWDRFNCTCSKCSKY